MNNKILFLFLIIFFVSSNKSFSQTFEVKGGVGFFSIYERNDIKYWEPFTSNVEYTLNPGFVGGLGLYFDLGDEFSLGGQFRIRQKSGKVEKIKIGFSYVDSSEVFAGRKFDFLNLELILNFKKNFALNPDLLLTPYVGFGLSYGAGETEYIEPNEYYFYPDNHPGIAEGPYFNNAGFLFDFGFEISYKSLFLGIGSGLELYELWLANAGNPKFLYINILLGYRI
jgi:hypothetical protein